MFPLAAKAACGSCASPYPLLSSQVGALLLFLWFCPPGRLVATKRRLSSVLGDGPSDKSSLGRGPPPSRIAHFFFGVATALWGAILLTNPPADISGGSCARPPWQCKKLSQGQLGGKKKAVSCETTRRQKGCLRDSSETKRLFPRQLGDKKAVSETTWRQTSCPRDNLEMKKLYPRQFGRREVVSETTRGQESCLRDTTETASC